MKKYTVLVTRNCTESAVVEVEAEDKESAAEIALERAHEESITMEWTLNDCTGDRPYLGDCVENDVQEVI